MVSENSGKVIHYFDDSMIYYYQSHQYYYLLKKINNLLFLYGLIIDIDKNSILLKIFYIFYVG